MTVEQLIAELNELPKDASVEMCIDNYYERVYKVYLDPNGEVYLFDVNAWSDWQRILKDLPI